MTKTAYGRRHLVATYAVVDAKDERRFLHTRARTLHDSLNRRIKGRMFDSMWRTQVLMLNPRSFAITAHARVKSVSVATRLQ